MIYQPKGAAREYAEYAANLMVGCSHGCLYCYGPAAMRLSAVAYNRPRLRHDALADFAKDCGKLPPGSQVHLGFITDPYCPEEAESQVTRAAIKELHAHGLGAILLTKGGSRSEREFDLLGVADKYGATLTLLDEADRQRWEPRAAPTHERMMALEQAHGLGIPTWASLEPVLDPAQTLEIIQRIAPYTEEIKVGKLNHHPHAQTIDWRAFGREAQALLQSLGVRYYLKKDLLRAMR